jgi:mono/diheme cytochrome c family protein
VGEIRVFLGAQGVVQQAVNHLFLDQRYPQDEAMARLEAAANTRINDYYRKQAEEEGAVDAVQAPAAKRYVGSGACQSCHAQADRVWRESGHHHAMQTLVDAGQEYNPLCVKCHVTGFEAANGFRNLTATPALANVQCEACHGPGAGHLENPSAPYGAMGQADCQTCHTADNSPEFDFSSYWERVKH